MRRQTKSLAALLAAGLLLMAGGCGQGRQDIYTTGVVLRESLPSGGGTEAESTEEEAGLSGETEAFVCVYVCGAVASPGVYELREGSRVYEAIRMAGGFTAEADQEWLNQAEQVRDGQRLRVYTKEETDGLEEREAVPELLEEGQRKVNLNTASKEELMTLSGIGEAKAEAILAYRQEHGAFASIEEIQNIPGIKSAVFSKIKDQIVV